MSVLDQNVVRLEIAMNEPERVHPRDSLRDFHQDLHFLLVAQSARGVRATESYFLE